MKHARDDYNRIQDPAGKIADDEPVFLTRAQDITAPDHTLDWAKRQLDFENPDWDLVKAAHRQSFAMRRWQNKHGVKIADLAPKS